MYVCKVVLALSFYRAKRMSGRGSLVGRTRCEAVFSRACDEAVSCDKADEMEL